MARRKRRKFTPQFKADAVRLVTTGAKTIAAVTEEFDLTETALRAWVKRAEADEGKNQRGVTGRMVARGEPFGGNCGDLDSTSGRGGGS